MKVKYLLFMLMAMFLAAFSAKAQLNTPHDDKFWEKREEGMKSYNVPEAGDANYTTIVYIDPSASTNGNGSEASPLNSWPSSLASKTAYLQKRGTSSSISINSATNYVMIGAYGVGNRPILKYVQLDGSYCVVRDIQTDGRINFGGYPYTLGTSCIVYNCEAKEVQVYGTETKVIGNDIHGGGNEGIWVDGARSKSSVGYNIEIAWNHIYNVNTAWYPGASESKAPGDGIQVTSANGTVHIHHNVIDRSSTGNKFNIIIGEPVSPVFNAIIENNVFYPPKTTSNGGGAIYLKSIIKEAIVKNNIIFDTNSVNTNVNAVWCEGENTQLYGNLIVGKFKLDVPRSMVSYYNNTVIGMQRYNAGQTANCGNNIFGSYVAAKGTNLFVSSVGESNLFVNSANHNYCLKEKSVAVDAGVQVSTIQRDADILGVPVPQNGKPDIGAYEYTTSSGGTVTTNTKPVAKVSSNQEVYSGDKVTLSAKGSYDPDGDNITFNWSGSVSLSSATTETTSFTAPEVSKQTVYTFTLVVSDGKLSSNSESVSVTVNPTPVTATNEKPIANAGNNYDAVIGETVTLDGSNSYDPDGDAITYKWAGPEEIALNSANSATPSFVVPSVTESTTFTFSLVVNDGSLNSTVSSVQVTVNPQTTVIEKEKPVAVVSHTELMVASEYSGKLSAAGSYHPNNDSIWYRWSTSSSEMELADADKEVLYFTVPRVGTISEFEIILRVYNTENSFSEVVTTVTVIPEKNYTVDLGEKLNVESVISSNSDENTAINVIDSLFNTRWSAEGMGEWIEFTLEGYDSVNYLRLAWYNGDIRVAYFDVEVSADGKAWNSVYTNGESNGTDVGYQLYDLKDSKAKYCRIIGYGNTQNDWNSITEVEFYGVPEKAVSTSINQTASNVNIHVYPNPVVSSVTVSVESSNEGLMQITDLSGKVVMSDPSFQSEGSYNLEDLSTGVYMINVQVDGQQIVKKLVKK